jgi:RIP metalloprotease RseP
MQAVAPAAKLVSSITKETAAGLITFFGQIISGSDTGGQQVSGPIGLIKTGSDVVATKNWNTVFAFAAAISINLGVVNAFPLPALDGGQLIFVLAEAATGRKIDQRLQEEIIGVTVLLLLFVSVSAALGDVQNLMITK